MPQTMGPLPDGFEVALQILVQRLQDCGVDWAITASLGLALQGLPLQPHDIDLQSDRAGVLVMQACLADYVIQPVEFRGSATIQSTFGRCQIGGVVVECMGDLQTRAPGEEWSRPPDIRQHRRYCDYHGLHLPVMDVAYEAGAYRRMGRLEKAMWIDEWLRTHER